MAMRAEQLNALLATTELPDLGPGPRKDVRGIGDLRREVAVAQGPRIDVQDRELLLAVVLLWHDHLEEAHRIAQEHESVDGSYVHAIVHRREPDYDNAKYWFRRVGQHPCYPELARQAAELLSAASQVGLAKKVAPSGTWDAFAFVDACEVATRSTSPPEQERVLREVQAVELRLLATYFAGPE